jgi:hypothetical protein
MGHAIVDDRFNLPDVAVAHSRLTAPVGSRGWSARQAMHRVGHRKSLQKRPALEKRFGRQDESLGGGVVNN